MPETLEQGLIGQPVQLGREIARAEVDPADDAPNRWPRRREFEQPAVLDR